MSSLTLLISLSLVVVPPGGDPKKDSFTKPTGTEPSDAKFEITGPYVHDTKSAAVRHSTRRRARWVDRSIPPE